MSARCNSKANGLPGKPTHELGYGIRNPGARSNLDSAALTISSASASREYKTLIFNDLENESIANENLLLSNYGRSNMWECTFPLAHFGCEANPDTESFDFEVSVRQGGVTSLTQHFADEDSSLTMDPCNDDRSLRLRNFAFEESSPATWPAPSQAQPS